MFKVNMKLPDFPRFIFDKTEIPLLEKGLRAYSMRQKSIADNIANVDTPGFSRSEVNFEEDLKKALEKKGVKGYVTQENHIQIGRVELEKVKPKYEVPKDKTLKSGMNNIDIDKEMAELAKNQINYQSASQLMHTIFSRLRSAIRGEAVR